MQAKHLFLPALALGGVALLLGPKPQSEGFNLLGGSLGTGQRDFRVFNNFTDATANDNTTPDTQFPDHQGAVMALWKACVEWGSGLHGNGNGDPTQPAGLGSGGANFDAHFQGEASGVGGTNDNIHSELSGSDGGVLAFTETPISDGWRIRYYSTWLWQDGPTSPPSNQWDIQGIACHEYGHALGLDHTSVSGSTMVAGASAPGSSQRSIATDDINGVKAIYGTKSGTKPNITNVAISGTNVTITGSNFSATNNQVWFTNDNVTSSGSNPTVIVTGVSSTGGGTSIALPLPLNAGSGDVIVQLNGTGNASLSNAFPLDTGGATGGGPLAITSISPSVIDALNVGQGQIVTITGTGFTPTTVVEVNGVALFGIPSPFTVVNSTTITFDPPNAPVLGAVTVEVVDGAQSALGLMSYQANATPTLQCGTGVSPFTFLTAAGLDVACASTPGDTFLVLASLSNLPSVFPGYFSLDIGNNLTSIFLIAQPVIASNGLATFHINTTLPPVTTFYMQGLAVPPTFALPFPDSNVQTCMSLF
jgi:hypothetical protein